MTRHPQLCGLRLLMDFLEHEVTKLALVRHVVHTAELGGHALLTHPCRVVELNTEGREQGHLAVFHRQDRAGEARQGRRVAGTKEFPFPQTDQQWGRLTSALSQITARA